MAQALALTFGSVWISLSTLFVWGGRDDAPLLLVLYVCVAAALLAWLSMPLVGWTPDVTAF